MIFDLSLKSSFGARQAQFSNQKSTLINRKSIRQRRAYQKLHGAAAGIRWSVCRAAWSRAAVPRAILNPQSSILNRQSAAGDYPFLWVLRILRPAPCCRRSPRSRAAHPQPGTRSNKHPRQPEKPSPPMTSSPTNPRARRRRPGASPAAAKVLSMPIPCPRPGQLHTLPGAVIKHNKFATFHN